MPDRSRCPNKPTMSNTASTLDIPRPCNAAKLRKLSRADRPPTNAESPHQRTDATSKTSRLFNRLAEHGAGAARGGDQPEQNPDSGRLPLAVALTNPTTPPAGTSNVTLFTATRAPNRRVSPFAVKRGHRRPGRIAPY